MSTFNKWLEAYDCDKQFSGKSYYDSDTGMYDEESARADEMKDAFEAGRLSALEPGQFLEYLNRDRTEDASAL